MKTWKVTWVGTAVRPDMVFIVAAEGRARAMGIVQRSVYVSRGMGKEELTCELVPEGIVGAPVVVGHKEG